MIRIHPRAVFTCVLILGSLGLAAGSGRCATGRPAAHPGTPRTGLEKLEAQVEEFTLPNGLHFVLVERHDSPVFSFQTVVNAGSANNQVGTTGLAHMMEHMAFKGTPWVGTRDAAGEPALLAADEHAYNALVDERRRGIHADSTRLRALGAEFAAAQAAADATVETDEFMRVLERAGAKDVNAYTSSDVTAYMYSIPSNRLELWAKMEGGRLAHPVFREFYKEREVVIEERRMSTESSPFGRLAEEFVHTAFVAHPYRFGTIGFPSDLQAFSRTQGEEFFHRHYVACNMTIAVVGDVTLADLRAMATRYFMDIPAGPAPPPLDTVEPEQRAERRAILEDTAQPVLMTGWHIPACTDPHYVAYLALADLLGGGDHARLQKVLVKDKQLAVSVETTTGFPGEKFPSLWGVLVVPASGVAPDSAEREVYRVIADVQTAHPFSQAELDGYKVRVRSGKLGSAEGNASLASELSLAQTLYGDWRAFFRVQERVQALRLPDLTDAMRSAFTRLNRTTAMIVNPAPADSAAGGH
jgi:predicted Zn-dependent peptidase